MSDAGHKVISTGNAQMDEVLNGGFPANSINIIMGQPGTGKTIFAEQLVFHHAAEDDRPILYLTTLSEPVAKVLTYLQRFGFFDIEKIGSVVHYEDIGLKLAKDGIDRLVLHIKEAIRSLGPKIIVIDSFKALHDLSDSRQQMRRMLFELTGVLTSYETTCFLVGEYTDEDSRALPEFAIADGIVQFLRQGQSVRDERFMRVLKLRGSRYLEGLHGCRITASGIEIYPRLVTPRVPENYSLERDRVSTGVAGVDKLIGGGLLRGSTTVLAGPTGSGKTTLALQFALDGLEHGERSLYMNLQENPTQLSGLINSLKKTPDAGDNLQLLYESPVELQIDSLIVKLFGRILEGNIKRVVIDSIGDLASASSDSSRLHNYLYSMIQHFLVKGVTAILTFETVGHLLEGAADSGTITRFSNMSDNIVLLGVPTAPDFDRRQIRCIKARFTPHDSRPHRFEITGKGIVVS